MVTPLGLVTMYVMHLISLRCARRVPRPFDTLHEDVNQTNHCSCTDSHNPRDISTNAHWIDAICVPVCFLEGEPRSRMWASSMVMRSKSSSCFQRRFRTLEQCPRSGRLDEDSLVFLDRNAWPRSVWTYQEVVNIRRLLFTFRGGSGGTVDGFDFVLDRPIWQFLYRNGRSRRAVWRAEAVSCP